MSRVPEVRGFRSSRVRCHQFFSWPLVLGPVLIAIGCSSGPDEPEHGDEPEPGDEPEHMEPATSTWSGLPEVGPLAPELSDFPTRDAQFEHLCSMNREDDFVRHLCVDPRPEIDSLAGLLELLGLHENSAFAMTANSTSLVMKAVSSVNPRTLIFPSVTAGAEPPAELNIVSFVRGEPFVEIATRNANGDYNFYLMAFERECDYSGGCDRASLFTEEIESGWTAYSVYPEEDLKDTPLDCLSCHQPGGFGTPTILRMQEFRSPWLHWFPQKFAQRTESDIVLLPRFLEAHSVDENYAAIPIATIETAVSEGSGAHLEQLLRVEGQAEQPNEFEPLIERELEEEGQSERWAELYASFLAGDAISVPYPELDPTDPALRAAAVESYVDVVTGAAERGSLVNLHDLFSEEAREMLGMVPPADADGQTVLNVACGRCHDGRAEPGLRRSRFNVKAIDEMSQVEKNLAIDRLQLDPESPLVMPPARFGPLPPEAIARAIERLQQ